MTTHDTKWARSAAEMAFGLGEDHPVRLINHRWADTRAHQYDMHFGVEIGVILEGKMRRRWVGWENDISSGQAWLCGMWEPHGFELLEVPCRATVFMIFPPALARPILGESAGMNLLAPFELAPQQRPVVSPELRPRMISLCEDIYHLNEHPEKIPGGETFILLKTLETLMLLTADMEPTQQSASVTESFGRIDKAISMVFNSRKYIPVEQAAATCHMHRNTFQRIFRKLMGIGFAEFSLRYRLRCATDELTDSEKPVKTIAADWGFVDTSHFHRIFQQHYGVAPTEFRKENPKS